MSAAESHVDLPPPRLSGETDLERLLAGRRSVRAFAPTSLSLDELGQLLWAAQGVTDPQGLRTAPSAGALYPLELYVIAGAVDGLGEAVYHYVPEHHRLEKVAAGDRRRSLAAAALSQSWVEDAAAVIAFTAVVERTARKYGRRARRYVDIEAGHAAQNLFLQAEALGLGTVVVGAFDDQAVAGVLELPRDRAPLSLMPVGRRR